MAFDEARYRREVLDHGLPLKDDLRWRYQLDEPLTAGAVTEAVKEVRACWRRGRARLKYRPVIEALEAGHPVHQPVFDAAAAGDLEPLRTALAEQGRREGDGRRRLVAALEEAADGLGLIAPATVEEVAAAHGVAEARVREALRGARIEVREPDALPFDAPHPAYLRCARQLGLLRLRHLADFLAADGPGGRVSVPLEPFTRPPPGERALDEAAVRWARLPHSAAQTAAHGVVAALRQVLRDRGPDGLGTVLAYELAASVREHRAARAGAATLLAHAVGELSVAEADARRLVFAVLHEHAGDPVTGRLRRLTADGLLAEAAAVLDRFPDGALPEEAAALAAHVRERLAEALRLRDRAAGLRGSDPDRGWELLEEAALIAADLPGADALRRALPARPVPRAGAVSDDAGVLVEWEPTPSTAGEPEYVVVRRVGRPPRAALDGTVLRPDSPGATSLRDTFAPDGTALFVGRPLYYGVAVRRGAEPDTPPSALAVCGPIYHRPEVAGVRLRAGDTTVTGAWRCPAGAESVEVTRDGDGGRAVRVAAHRDGFTDSGLVNGTVHRYRIAVVYRGPDGSRTVTEGVRLSATPVSPPQPVTALRVEPVPDDPAAMVARFPAPRGGDAVLYLLDGAVPWPAGTRLPVTGLRPAARPLTTSPVPGGLRFPVPACSGTVLAVTVAGDEAVTGPHRRVEVLPGLGAVEARRLGGEVAVAFDWPAQGVDAAEVSWTVAGSPAARRTVTRAAYLHEAGARIPVADGAAVEIEVRAVATGAGPRVGGAPSRTSLPARVEVGYRLTRSGLPGRRTLRAVFTARATIRAERLLLVRAYGETWPLAPEDGETLGELTEVELPAGQPVELAVPAPGGKGPGGRGYWLRCFAVGEAVLLRDPPTRELRVGRGRQG
ncbi:hypothetical protein HUT19_32275 [Streptomyces sp. NA02950]|uniref:hypothetical protein n=1 Tax=Streptomyces sp. NA02950 TaxID=2742137 RepID=UPI0015928178|nr:hypothetical protein [Streptomyces sp. NA02950]QKV95843.1 hypothetical protein HUT19_32275 [Streptomyces sp. NA02950]